MTQMEYNDRESLRGSIQKGKRVFNMDEYSVVRKVMVKEQLVPRSVRVIQRNHTLKREKEYGMDPIL
ncbi:MAG: hypothetical protein LJE96_00805 [Deltaproteobacteria bacterium]|nr:hypothetical protein [Deltaproteobacteria bacterium]